MSEQATPRPTFKALFTILTVAAAAIVFVAASLYTQFTTEIDPAWTDFSLPVVCAVIGARVLMLPDPGQDRKTQRIAGFILIGVAVLLLILNLIDLQGAN
jgi:predicted membrane channel-forming protein YqfA (hemolysin III family)